MGARFAGRVSLALAILLAVLAFAPAGRAQPPPAAADPAAGLAATKLMLDEIEAAAGRENMSGAALVDLRARAAAAHEDLLAKAADFGTKQAAAEAQLKDLGPTPADGPAEAPPVAAERARLTALTAELGAGANLARQLATRAGQVFDRVNERRRILFTDKLLERSPSLFDWGLWLDVARGVPDELRGVASLAGSWWRFVEDAGHERSGAALATLVGLALAGIWAGRWCRRRLAIEKPGEGRFGKAVAGLAALAATAVPAPLAIAVVIATLDAYALLPQTIRQLAVGLNLAVAVASFGRGIARGVLAPDAPWRRLPATQDATARQLYGHLVWAVRALAVAVFLNTVHRQVVAPLALTVATSALLALAVAVLLVHLLRRLRQPHEGGAAPSAPGLMAIGWIAATLILGALGAGYIGLATFIAERLVVAVVVLGAAYLTVVFIDALFAEMLVADKPAGRAVAANLGLRPQTVELVGTLVSAALRLVVIVGAVLGVSAVLVALGPRGLAAVEVFGKLHDTLLGAGIAGLTVSLGTVLAAVVLLLLGLLATRAVQRWLERQFLPRTGLEPGLQHSISAILGYVGVIAVAALALAELGIDLQKIALIAGALSVGIGFGLQSVVSNFVSGLILLAERPIRVGDSIVVKGEEGWVRRIRVRATEIETFERATVIIPNSELIAGVVKNWTHANTMGRIIVKVGVDYDSDPEQVRDLLLECAREHPQVVDVPPPRALLLAFGDNALEFELRCVVADFDRSLIVKSDLYFAILKGLRAAGIRIPAPQREVRLLGDGAAALAKPADA
jgi:potassium-dependent mechanosensitive channel